MIKTLYIALSLLVQGLTIYDYSGSSYDWRLSDNNVTAARMDSLGFVWIATHKELAKFDGKTFTPVDEMVNTQLFADDNFVESIVDFGDEVFGLCTAKGLFSYDLRRHSLVSSSSVSGIHIYDAVSLDDGSFIFNCIDGIRIYEHSTEKVSMLFPYPDHEFASRRITRDPSGNLWTVSQGDLLKIKINGSSASVETICHPGNFSQVHIDRHGNISLRNRQFLYLSAIHRLESGLTDFEIRQEEVTDITDSDWGLILALRGKGCEIVSVGDDGRPVSSYSTSLSRHIDDLSNKINRIYIDRYGVIWMCTRNGLFSLRSSRTSGLFRYLRNDIDDLNSLSHNTVSDILVDGRNTLWVATAGGLDRVNFSGSARSSCNVQRFYASESDPDKVSANKIEQIEYGPDGMFWLGTKEGMEFADPNTGNIFHRPELEKSFAGSSFVRAVFRDRDNNMWIGFSKGGLYRCSRASSRPEHIGYTRCAGVTEDKNGNIWAICGTDRLVCFKGGSPADSVSYSLNQPNVLFVDPYNTVWCGTQNGLYRYHTSDNSFRKTELSFPVADQNVVGVINDDLGNLWISGGSGVCCYSLSEGTSVFMVVNGGVFSRNDFVFSSAKDSDGFLYLSGINGLTIVDPSRMSDDQPYKCYFADFKVNDKELKVGSPTIAQDINYTRKIRLRHRDNQISFSFSALPFEDSDEIQYSYKLSGSDKNWVYAGTSQRTVTYSNIPHGHHILSLRCTSPMGIWQEPTELEIKVKAPIMLSWYFILLYAAFLALLSYLLLQWWKVKSKLQTQEAVSRSRQKFYREISYDIKNPYTLLRTPLQKLIDEQDALSTEETKFLLDTVKKGSDKLALLVDQLIDFSELDEGNGVLHSVAVDFVAYLRSIWESFSKTFKAKGISLEFSSEISSPYAQIDKEKMDNVFFELLSYVYRNSPQGGKASLKCCSSGNDMLSISLRSDCRSLSADSVSHFFDVGIGLSLTREVVKLHGGEISVRNLPDSGVEFEFGLPLIKAGHNYTSNAKHSSALDTYIGTLSTTDAPEEYTKTTAPLIYLVIKDDQLREFLENMFTPKFKVKSFSSPEDVYETALQDKPKLIISGILFFREMQGLELCRKVKASQILGDVPFIFLTAFSQESVKKDAYSAGADAFLSKPFDIDYLNLRVDKLMQSRDELMKKAKKEIIVTPKEVNIMSADEKFLTEAMKLIETNIDNEEFGVAEFSSQMHLSASMLYRKVKALTGMSPNEFLRDVRMKRAAQLLLTNAYSISEIAF